MDASAVSQDGYNDADLLLRLMLSNMAFLTTSEKCALYAALSDGMELSALSLSDLSLLVHRTVRRARWDGSVALSAAQQSLRLLRALSIRSTFFDSADFPALLREMADPPYALFYRGNLAALASPCVSVVGTRRATARARHAATDFAYEAAAAGCTVVSGLAYGVDVAAHTGALQTSSGATVAVLASGIDTVTPASHKRVAVRIIEQGGCLISEYAPGTPALAFRFVQRDRLIAALSPATVIVQAPSGSGALITAAFALEYGRDVLFHAAAFSPESQILERDSVEKLRAALAQGRNVSYKIENSPERYVSDGAPVIRTFAEYCACHFGAPGTAFCKHTAAQIDLF